MAKETVKKFREGFVVNPLAGIQGLVAGGRMVTALRDGDPVKIVGKVLGTAGAAGVIYVVARLAEKRATEILQARESVLKSLAPPRPYLFISSERMDF